MCVFFFFFFAFSVVFFFLWFMKHRLLKALCWLYSWELRAMPDLLGILCTGESLRLFGRWLLVAYLGRWASQQWTPAVWPYSWRPGSRGALLASWRHHLDPMLPFMITNWRRLSGTEQAAGRDGQVTAHTTRGMISIRSCEWRRRFFFFFQEIWPIDTEAFYICIYIRYHKSLGKSVWILITVLQLAYYIILKPKSEKKC
jgi:hypothetical protein